MPVIIYCLNLGLILPSFSNSQQRKVKKTLNLDTDALLNVIRSYIS